MTCPTEHRIDDEHHIREAQEDEYFLISVLLSNAFLEVWNHNWFQNIDTPSVPIELPRQPLRRREYSLSVLQERRRRFYASLMQLVLLSGGKIILLVEKHPGNVEDNHIMSILLWQPPERRPSLWHIIQSGFLRVALWDYGLRSLYRVQFIFEGNIAAIFQRHKLDQAKYGYVQMLATAQTQKARGHSYGEKLLRWQCERHLSTFPDSPGVLLDTTTESAVRVYNRIGFTEVDSASIDTGTDALGINLSAMDPLLQEKRNAATETCRQRVMMLRQTPS